MKPIHFQSTHRQKHFEYFNRMSNPHFNITANVEIGPFLTYIKEKELPFTPTLVYLLSRAANEIKEFRWLIRNNQVIEHTTVHPSYTVPTVGEEVFSFCCVPYSSDALEFIKQAKAMAEAMKESPSFEDEEGRDDFLFISAIPWVSFTSFHHAMNYNPTDRVPRIVWGKYFSANKKL